MVKNVKIKKAIKLSISPILSFINRIIPKNDKIVLLYSPNLGIEHNLKPFRDYLLKNEFNKDYKIICSVSKKDYYEQDGLRYIGLFKGVLTFLFARHVFYTTGQIPIKPSKKQIVVHMDHGTTAIKTGNLLTNINNGDDFFFTRYCAPSPLYIDVVKRMFNCSSKNVVVNSEPVTDIFYEQTKKYDLGKFKKIGLWAPTFRQSDYLGYKDSLCDDFLPTLKPNDYEELNSILKRTNTKLIVKFHNMQNDSEYQKVEFSNLELLSAEDFEKKGYDLYILLKQVDFLLADYSSVFLQFLLLNKPIGFVIPDLEEYKERRGFIFDNVLDYMPGTHIYNKQELYDFINDMEQGKDDFEEKRKEVNNKINYYQDGKSCERLISIGEMKKI